METKNKMEQNKINNDSICPFCNCKDIKIIGNWIKGKTIKRSFRKLKCEKCDYKFSEINKMEINK